MEIFFEQTAVHMRVMENYCGHSSLSEGLLFSSFFHCCSCELELHSSLQLVPTVMLMWLTFVVIAMSVQS